MAIAITGTYYHRTGWVDANWSRMQLAHDTNEPKALDSDFLYAGTFNISITSVDGSTASSWIPQFDNVYRQQAHEVGIDRGNTFSNGSDFLFYGNYINPDVSIITIQGYPLSNGQLYYAGSLDTFSSVICFIDTFTDSNGTAITSHIANTGQSWSGSGNATIESDKVEDVTSGSDSIFISDSGVSDVVVSIDVTTPSSLGTGIYAAVIGRSTDTDNFWMAQLSWWGTGNDHKLIIYKKESGSYTQEAISDTFTPSANTTYKITLGFFGADMRADFGGIANCSYSDSFNQSATLIGFRIYTSTSPNHPSCKLDNLYACGDIDRHSLEILAQDQVSADAGLICSDTIDDGNVVLVELNDVINWEVDYCCLDCSGCVSGDCGTLYFCNEPTIISITALDCACPAYEVHFADGNILTRPDGNPYQFYSCSKTQLCGCSLPNCMNVITSGTTGYIPDMQINLIRANYWEASGTYDFESCCGAGACTEQWQASYDPLTCILTVSAFQMEYGGNMVTNPSGQSFIYTADLSVLGCSLPITLDYVGGASGCSHDSTIQVDVC